MRIQFFNDTRFTSSLRRSSAAKSLDLIDEHCSHFYHLTMPMDRAKKRAALAKFREAKQKRSLGEEDDLFEGNIKEEEDVYDVYDEAEYESLVNSRRQREDFVVDDGKLNLVNEVKTFGIRFSNVSFEFCRWIGVL